MSRSLPSTGTIPRDDTALLPVPRMGVGAKRDDGGKLPPLEHLGQRRAAGGEKVDGKTSQMVARLAKEIVRRSSPLKSLGTSLIIFAKLDALFRRMKMTTETLEACILSTLSLERMTAAHP